MNTSLPDQVFPHPEVDDPARPKPAQRDSRARMRLIETHVDFTGKTVLDLGCCAGFFSLSAARKARHVIGIDADQRLIDHNREQARRLGIDNVEFVQAELTPAFLATLPHVDIVLFLSVFHHILVGSRSYDWNAEQGSSTALDTLASIRALGDTYVFEMGEAWEPRYSWSAQIAKAVPNPKTWIPQNVFAPDFDAPRAEPGVGYQLWPFRWWPRLAMAACHSRVGRTYIRQLGVNRRDFRTIYIGTRRGPL